jgi:hypothetical protein
VVFGTGYYDRVDQDARQPHCAWCLNGLARDALHLGDDDATRVSGRLGDRQRIQRERLLLHSDVAFLVGGRPPHQGDVDRESREEQALLFLQHDELDEVVGGDRVHPAALEPRIDEGA